MSGKLHQLNQKQSCSQVPFAWLTFKHLMNFQMQEFAWHLHDREESLAPDGFSKALEFDFKLTATVLVKNSQEFWELDRKTKNEITQMQKMIKGCCLSVAQLESSESTKQLQQLLCESVFSLAN